MNNIKEKILLVDDDTLISINEKAKIEEAGYACDYSNSVQYAWHLLKETSYDLIILDHDLADAKGINLIKIMKKNNIDIPIIYVSAARPQVLNEIAKIDVVQTVLPKPVSMDVILNTIKMQICLHKQECNLVGSNNCQSLKVQSHCDEQA